MFTYENFKRDGYAGPFLLFSPEEAQQALDLNYRYPDSMLPWHKGRHTVVRSMALLAKHPAIMYRLKKILGENILLWGSTITRLEPGERGEWHVDREHQEWESVSVWIALEHAEVRGALRVIRGSHLLNEEPAAYRHLGVDTRNDVAVLKLAQSKFSGTELLDLCMKNGEFVLLDGKAWHCRKNTSSETQYGILLQYCKPNQKVRAMKDTDDRPEIKWHSFEPECLLVSGKDDYGRNKVIDSEESGSLKRMVMGPCWYGPQNLWNRVVRGVAT